MTDLIEKLRRVDEPSRALSDEVLLACGWKKRSYQYYTAIMFYWVDPNKKEWLANSCPSPTEDVNAVLKLLPKGIDIDLYTAAHGTDCSVTAVDILDHETEKVLGCGSGHTVAMAICVAILEMKTNDL